MHKITKNEASGQVRPAKVAYLNDLTDAPNVNYAYEMKVGQKAPEMVKYAYNGNVRKAVLDADGNKIRYFPACADIEDLGLTEVMGSVGIEDGDGYFLLDVYEDRDGGAAYVENGDIGKYPAVAEAFARAKTAFLGGN